MSKSALAMALLMTCAPASGAELLRNGSFDDATGFEASDPSGGMVLGAGSRAIPGWVVGSGTVLRAGPDGLDETQYDKGASLANSVLLRAEADSILQTIDDLPGLLRFEVTAAVDYDDRDRIREELDVLVDEADDSLTTMTARATSDSSERRTYVFTLRPASRSPSLTLRFIRRGSVGFVGIDDVSVRPLAGGGVPEPAIWGTMLLGFGLVGAAARRGKPAHAA